MSKRFLVPVLFILTAWIGAPVALAQGGGGGGQSGNGVLITYLNSLPLQNIDAAELQTLNHMREEEKLARDVYLVLELIHGTPIFGNIAAAEQQHMDMVKLLLDRYGLPDPIPRDDIGWFSNPLFINLFWGLVTFGANSPAHAMYVGALIEDIDIWDLENAIQQTDNRDLALIYQNLKKGSRNHMRSFCGQLSNQGVTYVPIFLDQTALDAILNSPMENGVIYDENGGILWQRP